MAAFDFSAYAAVLLDYDGTLCHEAHALPGAAELVRRLEASGVAYAVLSNTTTSPREVQSILHSLGMFIAAPHIYTASTAAADYVLEKFPENPAVFNLATSGIGELLEGKVRWVESPGEKCHAVICGAPANQFAAPERQRVALRLLQNGAELVGICADRVYISPRGMEIGVGALAHMLAYAAGVSPTFTGKPNKIFFDHLCQRLGVAAEKCLLVGDNLEADVAGAAALGMKTILPLTGVTRAQDIAQLVGDRRPAWVIHDLTELL